MNLTPTYNDTTWGRDNPSACDDAAALPYYYEYTPPVGSCNGVVDYTQFPTSGCQPGLMNYQGTGTCQRSDPFREACNRFSSYVDSDCTCEGGCDGGSCSPIVVDVLGNGFSLTNVVSGVSFDLNNDGTPEPIGWTSSGGDDAWLVLDRNGNGTVDTGRELFGDVSPQDPPPAGEERNGFRALGLYDQPGWGGNGDGKIDQNDTVFPRLRLWQDSNHNGVSESCEMSTLPSLGLVAIDLSFSLSNQTDQNGNAFRFRSKVTRSEGPSMGRWAWDVFLIQ